MHTSNYHLCHLNIGPVKGGVNDPVMQSFISKLDELNQLAYDSPGFVWHLKLDINNPEHITMYGEPGMLFNMSVWESVETLYDYTYHTAHVKMLKRRNEWFETMDSPGYVLWWIPKTELPTLQEAKKRIRYLGEHGPSPYAFSLQHPFPPPIDVSSEDTYNKKLTTV